MTGLALFRGIIQPTAKKQADGPSAPRSDLERAISSALARPILIEESVPQAFVRRTCILIASGVLAFIAWSAIALVHEVSRASGTILPSGFERVVQHLEGGIIRSIEVREGDIVEAGQTLFVLDDAATEEDTRVLASQTASLRAQIEARMALTDQRSPDYSSIAEGQGDAVSASQAAFLASRNAEQARIDLLNSQIEQARFSLEAIKRQIEGAEKEQAYLLDDRSRTEALVKKGYATRALLAEKTNAVSASESRLRVFVERQRVAEKALVRAERNLSTYRAEQESSRAGRVEELSNALKALEGEKSKKLRRKERLRVVAPTRGIVKSLDVTTIGGVIDAGQQLATIVPVDEQLVAEARIPAEQFGHVRVGLPAQVKVTSYDFTRFGWIDGKVESVSPSAFQDDKGMQYFKVRLDLASLSPSNAPQVQVVPGMEIVADIITGEKTVLAYLLSPVRKAFNYSFAER